MVACSGADVASETVVLVVADVIFDVLDDFDRR